MANIAEFRTKKALAEIKKQFLNLYQFKGQDTSDSFFKDYFSAINEAIKEGAPVTTDERQNSESIASLVDAGRAELATFMIENFPEMLSTEYLNKFATLAIDGSVRISNLLPNINAVDPVIHAITAELVKRDSQTTQPDIAKYRADSFLGKRVDMNVEIKVQEIIYGYDKNIKFLEAYFAALSFEKENDRRLISGENLLLSQLIFPAKPPPMAVRITEVLRLQD